MDRKKERETGGEGTRLFDKGLCMERISLNGWIPTNYQ